MKNEKQEWVLRLLANSRYTVLSDCRVFSNFETRSIILGQRGDRYGYLYTSLTSGNRTRHIKIHQLMWLAFNGAFDERRQINHKDGNKTNNLLSNLEIVTSSENILHAFKLGLRKPHITSKLTNPEILAIKRALANFPIPRKELAAMFNVSRATIDNIANEKVWATK